MVILEGLNTLFVHLPKCGGTFIETALHAQYKNKSQIFDTDNLRHYSPAIEYKTKYKIIGNIRNPFSFYVSIWSYAMKCYKHYMKYEKREIFLPAIQDMMNKDSSIARRVFEDPNNIENFREWFQLINTEKFVYLKDPIRFSDDIKLPEIKESYLDKGIGLSTWRYIKMYQHFQFEYLNKINDDYLLDDVIKIESVDEDVKKLFGFEIDYSAVNYNKSDHLDYRLYYDQSMIDYVLKTDEYIFKKFNYDFE